MKLRFAFIAFISLLTGIPAFAADAAKPDAIKFATLDKFSWLAGYWALDDGKHRIDETWSSPAPDMLIGMGRTLRSGKTTDFEFLRIVAREDGVFYIAQPRGRPPVEFRLQSFDGHEAVFINPGHADHLQRIVYRSNTDGSMTARVEGTDAGKSFAEDYAYHRASGKP